MQNHYFSGSLDACVEQLRQQNVIAYPTEAVFGLGCDPDSKNAVMRLLDLKKRPVEKGLILIADDYSQFERYISDRKLTVEQREYMFAHWPGTVTFVVPATSQTPRWLTGNFDSLAIRVSNHPHVKALCRTFGKPLVSTSANLSGAEPCRKVEAVRAQFGEAFPVLVGETGGRQSPSEIRNILTGNLIRQG
ncbi:L-threonylcarbamoyladenylate synthase type 1 TsaC [Pantoea sp. Nvir]|uniref:L-threonylcarbamoyladenylate synthase type 1 TsaC n=1 Tax=Pantoea sp. Nvir TaxID=2576760 RepID=UPI001356F3E0|nr:L-threonylcarbamoyladenylate synthase type 1 TsaC [Pantoea sp. Nvir]MXP66485.1 L-threonylcarbamoyladenylate synthase type 1 TsaC [Pantoea sp. Nvir]CAJ0993470.1 Threonylcarbamoyl-AMP synthase [Pantoea sp. Nvir]